MARKLLDQKLEANRVGSGLPGDPLYEALPSSPVARSHRTPHKPYIGVFARTFAITLCEKKWKFRPSVLIIRPQSVHCGLRVHLLYRRPNPRECSPKIYLNTNYFTYQESVVYMIGHCNPILGDELSARNSLGQQGQNQ